MIYYSSWIYGWAVDSIIDLDCAWLGSSGWAAVDSYVLKSAGIGWSRMALVKATDCSMYLFLHKYGLDSSSGSRKSPREEVDTYKCFFQVLLASGLLLTHCLKPILCVSPGSVRDSLPTLSSCMDTRRHEKYVPWVQSVLHGGQILCFQKERLSRRRLISRHKSWCKYCTKHIQEEAVLM